MVAIKEFNLTRGTRGYLEAAISEMEKRIKAKYPTVTRFFIEAQSWQGHQRDRALTSAGS